MSKTSFSVMLFGLVISIAVLVLYAMIHGYVTTVLWGWFVVPTFGLKPLTVAQALGLGLVICHLRPAPTPDTGDWDGMKAFKWLLNTIVATPLLVLFFGYIIKQCL